MDLDLSEAVVPATIPADHYDRAARDLWEQQPWRSLFKPPKRYYKKAGYGHNKVPVKLNIGPWLDEQFFRDAWLRGKEQREGPDPIPCAECGEIIEAPKNGESVTKILKFHVKREHKELLKTRGTYNRFIENKHASRLDVTERRRLK